MGFVGAGSELVLIARAANIECELNQLSASLKPHVRFLHSSEASTR